MPWTATASNGAKLSGDDYRAALRAVIPDCPDAFHWMAEETYLIRDAFIANEARIHAERPELDHAVGKWTQFLRACDQNGWDVRAA